MRSGKITADTRARGHIADHDSSETDECVFTDLDILRHDGARPNPGVRTYSNVAVDHRTVADKNTCANLHSVRDKRVRTYMRILADQSALAEYAARNHRAR